MMIKTAYISSTYKDLKEHREAVYKALHKIRYDVVCMEDYVATDERNVDKCCAHASGCDIYIGIFARRYGYIPAENNPSGLSMNQIPVKDSGLAMIILGIQEAIVCRTECLTQQSKFRLSLALSSRE